MLEGHHGRCAGGFDRIRRLCPIPSSLFQLWRIFQDFASSEALGLAENQSDWYLPGNYCVPTTFLIRDRCYVFLIFIILAKKWLFCSKH
jgi:hypothetical protein